MLALAVIATDGATTALASADEATGEVPHTRLQAQTANGSASNASSAEMDFTPQLSYGATVTIDSVNVTEGGFVAIRRDEGASGPIIGVSRYLAPGSHRNVGMRLFEVPGRSFSATRLNESQTLTATAYLDTNNNSQFDYVRGNGSVDVPYLTSGSVVTNPATINVTDDVNSSGARGA